MIIFHHASKSAKLPKVLIISSSQLALNTAPHSFYGRRHYAIARFPSRRTKAFVTIKPIGFLSQYVTQHCCEAHRFMRVFDASREPYLFKAWGRKQTMIEIIYQLQRFYRRASVIAFGWCNAKFHAADYLRYGRWWFLLTKNCMRIMPGALLAMMLFARWRVVMIPRGDAYSRRHCCSLYKRPMPAVTPAARFALFCLFTTPVLKFFRYPPCRLIITPSTWKVVTLFEICCDVASISCKMIYDIWEIGRYFDDNIFIQQFPPCTPSPYRLDTMMILFHAISNFKARPAAYALFAPPHNNALPNKYKYENYHTARFTKPL